MRKGSKGQVVLTVHQDRPWNEPGPKPGREEEYSDRPTLKAIILDFSSVNNVDITSVQNLIDVRNQLDKYAAPDRVDWHLACINNRWTKRALTSAGFGFPTPSGDSSRWKPIFSVAEIGGKSSAAAAAETRENEEEIHKQLSRDEEGGFGQKEADATGKADEVSSDTSDFKQTIAGSKAYGFQTKVAAVHGLNRPLFHVDLTSALQSAVSNIERRAGDEPRGVGTKEGL